MNKWTTQEMAQRLARDIEPGWYVNIGIGMPEMVCENLREDDDIILQSENGILGVILVYASAFHPENASFDARFPNQNQTKHCWQK